VRTWLSSQISYTDLRVFGGSGELSVENCSVELEGSNRLACALIKEGRSIKCVADCALQVIAIFLDESATAAFNWSLIEIVLLLVVSY